MTRFGLPQKRVGDTLCSLLPLDCGAERLHLGYERVKGRIEADFTVLQIGEDPNSGKAQSLDRERRLDALAAETIEVAHYEYVKWWAGLQNAHELEERRAIELGTTYAVIYEY